MFDSVPLATVFLAHAFQQPGLIHNDTVVCPFFVQVGGPVAGANPGRHSGVLIEMVEIQS